MDIKTEVEENVPFSDVISQSRTEIFYKKYSDPFVCNIDSEKCIKPEIDKEIIIPDSFSKGFVHKVKCETVAYGDCETDTKMEIKADTVPDLSSQSEGKLSSGDQVVKLKKNNMDTKLEVKEELLWPERISRESSLIPDDLKGGMNEDFESVESARSHTEIDSGKTTSFCNNDISLKERKNRSEYEITNKGKSQKHDFTEITPEDKVDSSQLLDNGKMESRTSSLKQNNVTEQTVSQGYDTCKLLLRQDHKKEYKCDICEKKYTWLSNLRQHAWVHGNTKPFKCDTCGKGFTRSSHFKQHKIIHEGVKPYKCDNCGKSFTQLSNLKTHNLIHEGKKPHKCDICDKGFTQFSSLKTHKLTHEGKKPYKCDVCDKSFTKLSHLKVHNLIHVDKKPQCDICKKVFTRFTGLKRHNFIHEGGKPYNCGVCDKNFTNFSTLKRHNLAH